MTVGVEAQPGGPDPGRPLLARQLGPDVLRSITLAEAYVTAELVIGLNAACGP